MAQSGSQTDSFTKNVTILKREDVTLRNGDVFTPNNIEMSKLKREGQFKSSVEFSRIMKTDDVERRLKESFPILVDERFSCAAREAQDSARLNFYGDHRVWDGRTIKSKLKGGSALYIVMEEEDSLSAIASASSVQDHYLYTDNNQQDSFSAIASSSSVQGHNRYMENNQQVSQWLSQSAIITSNDNNNSSDTFLQADDSFDLNLDADLLPGSFDLQELMLFDSSQGLGDVFTDLNSAQLNGQSQIAQEGLPLSTSTDPSSLKLESMTMTDQMSSHETSHQLNNNGNWADHQVTPPTAAFQGNNKSQKDQVPSSSTKGRSDSGLSSEESLSQYQSLDQHTCSTLTGVDVKIEPSSGPLQGSRSFYLEFDKAVPESVISGWATFGKKQVKVWKTYEDCILHGKEIPSGEVPGPVTVTITSQHGDYLGKTQFTYVDQRKQMVEETVSNKRKLADFFSEVAKQFKSEVSDENTTQTCQQSALANEGNRSAAGDILKLLVYTAAQIGAEGFIRFIFSSSAGQNVFEAYRNESLLPEHIAEANGHENIATYIRDITKRFIEEDRKSQTQSTNIDWLELARAVEESGEQFESFDGNYVAQLREDEILERAYFGDTETNSDSEKERSDSEDNCKRHLDAEEEQQQEDLVNFEFAEVASTDSESERSCSGHQFEMESASKGFLDGELQHGGGGEKLLQLPDISTDSEKEKCDSIDELDAGLSKTDDPIQVALDPSYQLTEGIIHQCQLPEHVGDRWRDLARALGYKQAVIDAIQKEQGSSTKECCITILVRWMGRERRNTTARKLAEALVKIELKNVAEKVIYLDTNQGSEMRGKIIQLEEQLQYSEQENGEYEKVISEMKKNCKQLEEEGSKMRLRIKELEEKLSNTTQKYHDFEQKVLEMRDDTKQLREQLQQSEQRDLGNFGDPATVVKVSVATRDDFDSDQETRERQISRQLKNLNRELKRYVTDLLQIPEVNQDKLRTAVKLNLLTRLSVSLQEMYSKVVAMAAESCKCSEDLKREFYDFAYHGLRAEHNDLVPRVKDLESFKAEMPVEEKMEFKRLQQYQINRQRQVDKLENLWRGLFSSPESLPEATFSYPSRGNATSKKASSRTNTDPGRREQAKVPPADDDDVDKCKLYLTKFKQSSVKGMFRKKESEDSMNFPLLYSQGMKCRE